MSNLAIRSSGKVSAHETSSTPHKHTSPTTTMHTQERAFLSVCTTRTFLRVANILENDPICHPPKVDKMTWLV
jgi:hypothetical protein